MTGGGFGRVPAAWWRFALVGGLATALHLLVLAASVEWWGLGLVAGSVAGFGVAWSVSYALNRHWTFRRGRAGAGSLWRYALVCLGGLVLNTAMTVALVHWLRWPYLLAQLSVIFVVPVISYLLSRHWAFGLAGPAAR